MTTKQSEMLVYVGNFTRIEPYVRGRAEGINVYRLDPVSGAMTLLQTAGGALNPTFLALDPAQRHLYAVVAVPEIDGHSGGAISAYAIDQDTGHLRYLNRQSTGGSGPCHVTVEASGRFVLATNYPGGSVAVLPIQPDGSLSPASGFIQHTGTSVNPTRQEAAHAHSINIDAANRFAIVCDLGMDKVLIYRLDLAQGKLVPHEQPWVQARPGAGPRHLAFHPNGRIVYVINELDSTVSVYSYDADGGRLSEVQAISTLPADWAGENFPAEVCVAPSGRFVYGSNRGHNSIAVFAVDEQTGKLSYVGNEPSQGKTPRNFRITPDGMLMLVANQDTDTIVAFRVDQQTGKLTPTGQITASPSPVCIKFLEIAR
jgi:6-phosphogluconolactonase